MTDKTQERVEFAIEVALGGDKAEAIGLAQSLQQLQTDARLLADMILNYGWHVPPRAIEAAMRLLTK